MLFLSLVGLSIRQLSHFVKLGTQIRQETPIYLPLAVLIMEDLADPLMMKLLTSMKADRTNTNQESGLLQSV